MTRIIHVRIDAKTEKRLVELRRRMGWNDSKLIREGIKALAVLLNSRARFCDSPAKCGLGLAPTGLVPVEP
jgi:hypothetical protein